MLEKAPKHVISAPVSRSKCTHIQTDILNSYCSHCRKISQAQSFQEESHKNLFMNLTLLLHIERQVAFPPEITSIPVLCILQIKHFKIFFPQFLSQKREVFGLVISFSTLCLERRPKCMLLSILKTKYQYCSNFSVLLFSVVSFTP